MGEAESPQPITQTERRVEVLLATLIAVLAAVFGAT
jgi:hypothetical protein